MLSIYTWSESGNQVSGPREWMSVFNRRNTPTCRSSQVFSRFLRLLAFLNALIQKYDLRSSCVTGTVLSNK